MSLQVGRAMFRKLHQFNDLPGAPCWAPLSSLHSSGKWVPGTHCWTSQTVAPTYDPPHAVSTSAGAWVLRRERERFGGGAPHSLVRVSKTSGDS